MIFKCVLAIWLRSLTVEISYVSSTGEVVSFPVKTGNRLTFFGMHRREKLHANISEKSFKFAMLIKFFP